MVRRKRGRNLGPRPMELLLAGAGGCSAFDVVMILKKSRQMVTGCVVSLSSERATEDPKVFYQDPLSLSRDGAQAQAGGGGARRGIVENKILLGFHHAGRDRSHYR